MTKDRAQSGFAGSSDAELLERAKAGESAAFEHLYRRHHRTALTVAACTCGWSDAEDAVQATFIAIWRNLDGYRPEKASFRTWMHSIVRHRAIDILRAKGARPQPSDSGARPHDEEDPVRTDSLAAERERSREVRKAVAELPHVQREVVELAYFGDLSQSEIATALKLPLGTVKGRARLALRKLPERLAEFEGPVFV